jgi:hypothetical protein
MGRFGRAKLRAKYLRFMGVGSVATLLAGAVVLAFVTGRAIAVVPWMMFAVAVGLACLPILIGLFTRGSGPFARSAVASVFFLGQLLAILGLGAGYVDALTNRAGPLGEVWDKLGYWLSASSLGLFDSVGWRLNLICGLVLLLVYPIVRAVCGAEPVVGGPSHSSAAG